MTEQEEILYAMKECLTVLTEYDTGEDFALFSARKRLERLIPVLSAKIDGHGGPSWDEVDANNKQ